MIKTEFQQYLYDQSHGNIVNSTLDAAIYKSKKKGTIILVNQVYDTTIKDNKGSITIQRAKGVVLHPGKDSNTFIGYYRNDWLINNFIKLPVKELSILIS